MRELLNIIAMTFTWASLVFFAFFVVYVIATGFKK